MNPAKTAEPIEMPFWLWTGGSARNRVLNRSPDLPTERDTFVQGILGHAENLPAVNMLNVSQGQHVVM